MGPIGDAFSTLPPGLQALVNDACDRFESELRAGALPRVEDHLAGLAPPARDALLPELLILAFEDELARHGAIDVGGALCRFPGDGPAVLTAAAEARRCAAQRASPGGGEALSAALGRFRLKEVLGRGAFGTVFRAEDPGAGCDVALKVPHPAALLSPDFRRRFLREAEAARGFDHPHLVAVREVGEAGPVCYVVRDYVPGLTLADWLDARPGGERPVPPRLAAALVRTVAEAVGHAHARGVLHCDLKPANVLLRDGRPECPVVADFGLARLVGGPPELTQTGVVLGTPAYMAPEQAAGRRPQLTASTDVYGLGAVLYELLTGGPPFAGETFLDTLRLVLTEEPVRPRALVPGVPAALEAVCLKCLEMDPGRRYAGAADLAADLAAFLDGRPVRARLPSVWRRLRRWCRRHPLRAVASGFAILTGLVVLAVVGVAGDRLARTNRDLAAAVSAAEDANRLLQEEARAREERARGLRLRAYADGIFRAEALLARHDLAGFRRLMDGCRPAAGEEDLRGFEWYYLDRAGGPSPHKELVRTGGDAYSVALRPDGRLLAVGGRDGSVRLLDPESGRELYPPLRHPDEVNEVAFAPGGDRVATACDDGAVRVWGVGGGGPVVLGRHGQKALTVAFAPDGRRLASGGRDGTLRVWDLGCGDRGPIVAQSESGVRSLAWASDGRFLVTGEEDSPGGNVKLWDAAGRCLGGFRTVWAVKKVAVTRQGRRVLAAVGDGSVRVWDADADPTARGWVESAGLGSPGDDRVNDVALSWDGSRVLLARETAVEVWCLQPPRREAVLRGDGWRVWAACFTPGGDAVIGAGADGCVRRWDLGSEWGGLRPLPVEAAVRSLAFDGASSRLAAAGGGREALKVWRLDEGGMAVGPWGAPISPAGLAGFDAVCRLFSLGTAGTLRRWEPGETLTPVPAASVQPGKPWRFPWMAFGPGGRFALYDGTGIRVSDPEDGKQLQSIACGASVRGLVFGPGEFLAAACADRTVRVWDARTGEPYRTIEGAEVPWPIAVSRDGTWLAGGSEASVRLWSLADGAERTRLVGHRGPVLALAFSPDGRTLASGGGDGALVLWQVETGQEMLAFADHSGGVGCLAFSPDGRILAAAAGQAGRSEVHLRAGTRARQDRR